MKEGDRGPERVPRKERESQMDDKKEDTVTVAVQQVSTPLLKRVGGFFVRNAGRFAGISFLAIGTCLVLFLGSFKNWKSTNLWFLAPIPFFALFIRVYFKREARRDEARRATLLRNLRCIDTEMRGRKKP